MTARERVVTIPHPKRSEAYDHKRFEAIRAAKIRGAATLVRLTRATEGLKLPVGETLRVEDITPGGRLRVKHPRNPRIRVKLSPFHTGLEILP